MEEEKSRIQRLEEKLDVLTEETQKKPKQFKIPWKARVGKGKAKKGFVTVLVINENDNGDFEKVKIEDGTFKLKGGTTHAIKESVIITVKGKPFIIQATKKMNPYNPNAGEHETYGHKYILARMLGDQLKIKKAVGIGAWVMVGLVVLGIVYYLLGGTF